MLCLIILTVSFLADCGNTSLDVWGLCWINEDTLVVAAQTTKMLWKLTVNKTARTCDSQMVVSGYPPSDVACSRGGRVFVTEYHSPRHHPLSIRIYDVRFTEYESWNPNITLEPGSPGIAVNEEYIVIGSCNAIHVFSKNRVFLYRLNMNFDQGLRIRQLYITDSNILWGAWERVFVTVNLLTGNIRTWHNRHGAWGVGGIHRGPMFVTRYPAVVDVYSQNGNFLFPLAMKVPNGTIFGETAAVMIRKSETHIAFDSVLSQKISIYMLRP